MTRRIDSKARLKAMRSALRHEGGVVGRRAPSEAPRPADLRLAALESAPPTAHGPAPVLSAVEVAARTPEARMIREAQERSSAIMDDPRYRELVGAMIGFRRGYVVAYRALHALLEGEPDLPALVEDLIVNATAYGAAQAFDERQLMEGMIETVLPWMGGLVDAHIRAEDDERRAERARVEAGRRARPVPLGFTLGLVPPGVDAPPDGTLARDQGLVLVGDGPALLWLVDRLLAHVRASADADPPTPCTVVRFRDRMPRRDPAAEVLVTTGPRRRVEGREATRRDLIELAPNLWEGCCNTNRGLAEVMGTYAFDLLPGPPDLLICDAMPRALTAGSRAYAGRPAGAVAGDAFKQFAKWCRAGGAAFIGLIAPEDGAEPDIRGPAFEQLRAFAHLRGVRVQDNPTDPDSVLVLVGEAVLTARKGELAAYRGTRLVT